MSENNTALIQFQELPVIAANAPAIYENNVRYLKLMREKGQGLLDTIEAEGMNPELDAECNKFLITCKQVKEKANTARAPITRMFDAFASEFTAIENQMEVKKADTIPAKIQEYRNQMARDVASEQQRKANELRTQQLASQERIDITAKIQLRIRERFNEILFAGKKKFNDLFNTMTLDNIFDVTDAIKAIPADYDLVKFNSIACPVTAIYIKTDDLAELVRVTRAELYPECAAEFKKEMEALQQYLTDQIPSRMAELDEIAEMEEKNKVEADRLKREAQIRQDEAALQLKKDNALREQESVAKVNTQVLVGQADLSFKNDVAQAEIFSDQVQSVKHSYVIKVMTKAGWQQIAALWFKAIASKVPQENMEKKTLGMMKKDLEVLALNGGERLADSGHLVYEQDVKALTKKV